MPEETETCRLAFLDIQDRPYTRVSYGLDFATTLAKHLNDDHLSQRAYLLASKGLTSLTDVLSKLEQALGERLVGMSIGGIRPHTPWDDLVVIINEMRHLKADALITLGGGTLADGAKLIVYGLANGVQNLEDLENLGRKYPARRALTEEISDFGCAPTVPILCVPTTLSGAEYSRFGAGTNLKTHEKTLCTHPKMYASLVILDPKVCLSTPDWVWKSTGVRGIDHCVENICSSNSKPGSDVACERGLVRLVRALLAYTRNKEDLGARLEAMLGANDAMYGLTLFVWVGASHGIGHQLGPLGVGHGQTSCILLPTVMKYNAKVNQGKQNIIKRILWDEDEIAGVFRKRGLHRECSDVGDALRAIFDELGMPASLKEVGVGHDKFDVIARNSVNDPFCLTNPIPLTEPRMVMDILELVAGD